MKLGSWNMLEQELLKSFLEAKSDRMVYALAAGFLEMMGPSRAHCLGPGESDFPGVTFSQCPVPHHYARLISCGVTPETGKGKPQQFSRHASKPREDTCFFRWTTKA